MGQNQSGQNFGQGGPPGGAGGDKKDQVSRSGTRKSIRHSYKQCVTADEGHWAHKCGKLQTPAVVICCGSCLPILAVLGIQVAPTMLQVDEKKKKWEPPVPPPRVGKKQKKRGAAAGLGTKLPNVTPNAKCKLRLLKLERVKDWLLMEEEFVANQERLKPQEERNEEDRSKVLSC